MADMSIRGTQPQPAPSKTEAAETLRAAGGATDAAKARIAAIQETGRGVKTAGDTVAPTSKAPKAATTWTIEEKILAVMMPPLGVVIGIRKAESARQRAEGAGAVGKLAEGAAKAARIGGVEELAKQVAKSAKRPAQDSVSGKVGKAVAQTGAEAATRRSNGVRQAETPKPAAQTGAEAAARQGRPSQPAVPPKAKSPNND